MKLIVPLLFVLATSFAFADARIEIGPNGYDAVGDNKAHFPFDVNDTDNEFYAVTNDMIFNAQTNSAYALNELASPESLLPDSLLPPRPRDRYKKFKIIVTGDDTGEVCTIEANNTEYTTGNWESKIVSSYSARAGFRKLRMTQACLNGVAED